VACLQAPDGASLVHVAYLAPAVAADALGSGEDDRPSMAAAAFQHSEPLLAELASPALHHLPNVLEGKASALRRRQGEAACVRRLLVATHAAARSVAASAVASAEAQDDDCP